MPHRDELIRRLESHGSWDIIVIGGGATGLGTAVDAASRGYRTLLLEGHDFAKGTSSRSTKLIHGGVRYLRQGNVKLVRESLHERGLLLRNAAGLVQPLQFIIPTRSRWEMAYYWTGMKAYDLLAGRYRIAASRALSRETVLRELPALNPAHLAGGVRYFDAQFDDARLALALVQALVGLDGLPLNYAPVTGLLKQAGRLAGVAARDAETGREFELTARAVVNCTGAFSDTVRRMDDPAAAESLSLSQGIHIVLDRSFFPGDSALIVPETEDGRVLFLIPWQGAVLVGTTDTPVEQAALEPRPRRDEIAYLLEYTAKYLARPPQRSDIRSTFAGLRPLVRSRIDQPTSQLARDHVVHVAASGLVTVSGGKWTTYRIMGRDAVKAAVATAGLEKRPSRTAELVLPCTAADSAFPDGREEIGEAEILSAVRDGFARTVEDVLARRWRLLFVDARAASEAAPRVAAVMARELQQPDTWIDEQVEQFRQLARGYLAD